MNTRTKITNWTLGIVILLSSIYGCDRGNSNYINGSSKSTYVVVDSIYSFKYGTVLTVKDGTGFSTRIVPSTEKELKLCIGDTLYE